jgi:DNA-binding SARP family transcriptional activator
MHGPYSRTAVQGAGRGGPLRISVLDTFRLVRTSGERVHVAVGEARVLAFLALHDREVPRAVVGGRLWPDVPEPRSRGSLRSALWRIGLRAPGSVIARDGSLALAPDVEVDLRELAVAIEDLRSGSITLDPAVLVELLDQDLVPDWDEEWIVLSREHWRQHRLHALDLLAGLLSAAGDWALAAEAGMAALRTDPLRETAHEVLIRTYLAEGNRPDAVRQYRAYVELLRDELNLEPSPRLRSLVEEV